MASDCFAHSLLRAYDCQHRQQLDQVCDRWRDVLALVGMGGTRKLAIAELFERILPDSRPENLQKRGPCPHPTESSSFPSTTPLNLRHFSNFRSRRSNRRPAFSRYQPSTTQTCNCEASYRRADRLAGTYFVASVILSYRVTVSRLTEVTNSSNEKTAF
jgi:hypothetical protein